MATLNIVGLGLSLSLTERGKALIESSEEVWLDNYTVIVDDIKERISNAVGKEIKIAERKELEGNALLNRAEELGSLTLLVVGEPFFATTHTTLYIEAIKRGFEVRVEHASSIFNVVGKTGLSPYRFGGTVTLPKWLPNYKPTSAFDRIAKNITCGFHTLMLVDISDGKPMDINEAFETMRKIDAEKKVINEKELFIISRAGRSDELLLFGTIDELEAFKSKIKHPYSFIIPAEIRGFEEEATAFWREKTKAMKKAL